jgi:hypothetical protein
MPTSIVEPLDKQSSRKKKQPWFEGNLVIEKNILGASFKDLL